MEFGICIFLEALKKPWLSGYPQLLNLSTEDSYPEKRGKPLTIVPNSEVLWLRSHCLHNILIKSSSFFLKKKKKSPAFSLWSTQGHCQTVAHIPWEGSWSIRSPLQNTSYTWFFDTISCTYPFTWLNIWFLWARINFISRSADMRAMLWLLGFQEDTWNP